VAYDSTLSSTPACDSTLSSKIFVGAMRMDVSSTQAPLRIRVATETGEDSTLSIQSSQSAGGGQEPMVEASTRRSRLVKVLIPSLVLWCFGALFAQ